MSKYTNALYPDKINDLVNNDGSLNEAVAEEIVAAAAPKIEGTSLVIPEQEGPAPIIEIDGVKYYHKQEFDINPETAINFEFRYDIITGEQTGGWPYITYNHAGGPSAPIDNIGFQAIQNSQIFYL